ncbi:MAG: tRNA (adenosine(37)-N6)-dimethylallyltransferase MiaA [Flavobacteriaceae bacterium]|jgi:tRNA dimethylallyltransferase
MSNNRQLIYIAGPTAVGKTSLSVALAQHYQTEILSCDARQCYREMEKATAVPTKEEQQGVPHHFIQNKSIHQTFDAGDFEKEALVLLDQLFQKHQRIIMVGGSGLYAKALMKGLDSFPPIDILARAKIKTLFDQSGLEGLQKTLADQDPEYYQKVDLKNPRRLIRALEVCETAKKPYSSFLGQAPKPRSFTSQTLLLSMPRPQLYERIDQRVDKMLASGLEKEALGLYPYKTLPALQTVGYQEWFDCFDGKYSRDEAIAEIKKNTRRYAKRQITWFKKTEHTVIEVGSFDKTLEEITTKMG